MYKVYFLKKEYQRKGRKVGYTKNIQSRLQQANTFSDRKIICAKTWNCQTREEAKAIERAFLTLFSQYGNGGKEWIDLCGSESYYEKLSKSKLIEQLTQDLDNVYLTWEDIKTNHKPGLIEHSLRKLKRQCG